MRFRTCLMAAIGIVAASRGTVAQRDRVTLRGVAYDSLRREPLVNAAITIAGSERTATSDSRGRFHFDSVAPGVYTLVIQHAALDSVGFSGLTTRATITDGRSEVPIAIPSFATFWSAACGVG